MRRSTATLLTTSLVAVLLLPRSVDSWLLTSLVLCLLGGATVWGWVRHQWLALFVIATFIVMVDLFGFLRSAPNGLWFAMLMLWLGGSWVVSLIGEAPTSLFHQALASFLVLEVFLALQLWPIHLLSKAVIAVAFAYLLWQELTRTVPAGQRVRESVLPFFLIVMLMTLTGQWLTF